jgi:prolipoprotein diacylglyceryl transferase
MVRHVPLSYIPSPPSNGFHIGPLFFHYYGLMYVIGITLAVLITRRRVRDYGGDPSLVADVALWAVPAGIIGARIYFDITTPAEIPHEWYGVFAVWQGGLGIWGGVAGGALAGVWRLSRRGVPIAPFADAVAPALLVAQAIGRIGNYFNSELYGKPTTLPWALRIAHPPGYPPNTTFQPTFLYELIWDLALAALLVWLGHHTRIRPPGLFALYVTGYSAFRIYEESLRIDYSEHFLGLRLNTFVASALTVAGIAWFIYTQRRQRAEQESPDSAASPDDGSKASSGDDASEASEASGTADDTEGTAETGSREPETTASATAPDNQSNQ